MGAHNVQTGSLGVEVRLEVTDFEGNTYDLSSYTLTDDGNGAIIKKPSGETVDKSLNFVTDGTDGLVRFYTSASDTDELGRYELQAEFSKTGTNWRTEVGEFFVKSNLSS
jgi:hypothetical protein